MRGLPGRALDLTDPFANVLPGVPRLPAPAITRYSPVSCLPEANVFIHRCTALRLALVNL
jgi:hypothetical protein